MKGCSSSSRSRAGDRSSLDSIINSKKEKLRDTQGKKKRGNPIYPRRGILRGRNPSVWGFGRLSVFVEEQVLKKRRRGSSWGGKLRRTEENRSMGGRGAFFFSEKWVGGGKGTSIKRGGSNIFVKGESRRKDLLIRTGQV